MTPTVAETPPTTAPAAWRRPSATAAYQDVLARATDLAREVDAFERDKGGHRTVVVEGQWGLGATLEAQADIRSLRVALRGLAVRPRPEERGP